MRHFVVIAILASSLMMTSCRKEPMVLLDEYETADVAARAWNFQVFPGAKFLPANTEVMRRAHFLLNPGAVEAPPLALYAVDASLDDVAQFYATKYGWERIAEAPAAADAATPAPAYFTSGDLGTSFAEVLPLLDQLDIRPAKRTAEGAWRGAHIDASGNMPRVSLQRPWVDVTTGETVDSTLILLVRDLPSAAAAPTRAE